MLYRSSEWFELCERLESFSDSNLLETTASSLLQRFQSLRDKGTVMPGGECSCSAELFEYTLVDCDRSCLMGCLSAVITGYRVMAADEINIFDAGLPISDCTDLAASSDLRLELLQRWANRTGVSVYLT